MFLKSSKRTIFHFFQFLVLLNTSEQDREPLSALSLDCLCQHAPLPFPVQTIPKKEQKSLSAPRQDCLCQAGASSWSGGSE